MDRTVHDQRTRRVLRLVLTGQFRSFLRVYATIDSDFAKRSSKWNSGSGSKSRFCSRISHVLDIKTAVSRTTICRSKTYRRHRSKTDPRRGPRGSPRFFCPSHEFVLLEICAQRQAASARRVDENFKG
jgi:hypothetical protein